MVGEGDAEPTPLVISFYSPVKVGEDQFDAEASVTCKYFAKRLTCRGLDGVQALLGLPLVVHGYLKGQADRGLSIFWLEPGDLDDPGFWGARRLTLDD